MLIYVFVMLHPEQTQKSYKQWKLMPFSRMCGTITLTKHTHNANLCFCHVTTGTNALKSYIQWKLMYFSSNALNNHIH